MRKYIRVLLVVFAVSIPGGAAAANVDVRPGLTWISAGGAFSPAKGRANQDNALLRVPEFALQTELWPNVRVGFDAFELVLRPRMAVNSKASRVKDRWQSTSGDSRTDEMSILAEWTELFASWQVSDSLALTFGRQNFQWGPSELVSPSNRIFHETYFARNALTLVPGKDLVRVNVSIGRAFSAIVLIETHDNGDTPFNAADGFEEAAATKVEYSRENGIDYVGVTAGKARNRRPWFGWYGSYELFGGLSLYFDMSHTRGSRALYPIPTPLGFPTFAQTRVDKDSIFTFGVAGARYAFTGGADLRIEAIYNEAGYTRRQVDQATDAVRTLAAVEPQVAMAAYAAPGLEFIGQRYLYASLRVPELPPGEALSVQARYLAALADGSGSGFVDVQYVGGDAWMLFLSLLGTHGGDDRELTRFARAAVFAGSRYGW